MAQITLNFFPGSSGDDGYWRSDGSAFYNGEVTCYIGHDGTYQNHSFVNFKNVIIPPGSTIESAYIYLSSDLSLSGTDCNLNIYLNDDVTPTPPTNCTEADAIALTAAVAWSGVEAWTAGYLYASPDIKSIVQVLIDKTGWVIGGDIMAVIKNNSSTSGAYRRFRSQENSEKLLPMLRVTITLPAGWSVKNSGVGGDDGWWTSSTFNNSDTIIYLGDNSGTDDHGFFRFPNIAEPQGISCPYAYFVMNHCMGYLRPTTLAMKIYLNDADNAVAPTTYSEAEGLSLTSGIDAFDYNNTFKFIVDFTKAISPNIGSLLEAVFGREGWSSGNALMIILKDDGSTQYIGIRSYNYGSLYPQLIYYTEPAVSYSLTAEAGEYILTGQSATLHYDTGAPSGANAYPLILAENIFLFGDPMATDTETGYDVANIVDYRTYTYWKAASAGTKYITVDCGTEATADALGIVGHNLYTANADVSVESSPDNSTWTERLAAFTPTSDTACMKIFTAAAARYWRVKIVTASIAARIAVIFLGQKFEFPRYLTGSFDPFPEEISAVTSRSKTGNLLGSILDIIMSKISIQFTKMTETWVINEFKPLWDGYLSQLYPFFWAWEIANHPGEVYYGKIPDDFTLSRPYDPWRRTVTLKIETVKE